eukprot:TRINITY_DN29460_c0_g1_i1.p1 TRINITY_DN29460_c0_g1~~TRINITY_DN29460_c0_g1_i1.p1  ORF type:complete len:585 (-),score=64.25 TRINITY_DN29460_c0_g1_i1:199-1953(-)
MLHATQCSVSNMLQELSRSSCGVELPPPPGMGEAIPSSLHRQNQLPDHLPCKTSARFGGTEAHWHSEQVARSVTCPSQKGKNPAMINQQRSFSEPHRPDPVHGDPFDEFVLFDRPGPGRFCAEDLPMIEETEEHSGFQLPMVWGQPKSMTDQPQWHRPDAELKSRSVTDPRYASSSESVENNTQNVFCSSAFDVSHMPRRSPTDPASNVQLVLPRGPTDQVPSTFPDNFPVNLPASMAGFHSSRSAQMMQPKTPTVPASVAISDGVSFHQPRSRTSSETVLDMPSMPQRNLMDPACFNLPDNATFRPPRSTASTAPNVGLMLPRSPTDPAYATNPETVTLAMLRNQVGSISASSDVLRSLTDLASTSSQDSHPSIDAIVAAARSLLKQAEDMRDKPSLATGRSMPVAAARSMTPIAQPSRSPLMPEAAAASNPIAFASLTAASTDVVDDEGSESADSGSDYDVLVGPTELVSSGLGLCSLALPSGDKSNKLVPMLSRPHFVAVSDGIRLARAQSFAKPLSFGSALHLMGKPLELCRPCMFEQRPGRCRKSFCCDFCHVGHRRSARKAKTVVDQERGRRSRWATA